MPKGVSLSPDGKHVYVTNFGQANGKNIYVFDAETLARQATIDVPGNVVESVLSPDGATIYASNFLRNSVQFIDLKTRKVTREIPTGLHPKILVPSPDGKSLFAANWSGQSVTQIDIATGKAVRTLRTTGLNPRGMAMTRAGVLFAANFNGASIDIFRGPELGDRHTLPACPIPRHLTLSPDDRLLFISCYHDSMLHAVDVATEKVVHTLACRQLAEVARGLAGRAVGMVGRLRQRDEQRFGRRHATTGPRASIAYPEWTAAVDYRSTRTESTHS